MSPAPSRTRGGCRKAAFPRRAGPATANRPGGQDKGGRVLRGHHDIVFSVASRPDGAEVASGAGDGTIRLCDASSGRLRRRIDAHDEPILSVAYDPDGRMVASGSDDGTARLWSTDSGDLLCTLSGHSGPVSGAAWSRDGRWLVTTSYDGTALIWNTASGTGVKILRHPRQSPFGGRVLAAGWRAWRRRSGECGWA